MDIDIFLLVLFFWSSFPFPERRLLSIFFLFFRGKGKKNWGQKSTPSFVRGSIGREFSTSLPPFPNSVYFPPFFAEEEKGNALLHCIHMASLVISYARDVGEYFFAVCTLCKCTLRPWPGGRVRVRLRR